MKKAVKSYDSMKAASVGMGVPMDLLRAAKSAGCPAFKGSRVLVAEYQEWAKDNPDGTVLNSKEEWQVEKLKKDCRKLDLQYEQELGELIPRGDLKDAMASAFQPIIGVLERHLEKTTYNALCRDIKAALTRLAGERDDDAAAEEAT